MRSSLEDADVGAAAARIPKLAREDMLEEDEEEEEPDMVDECKGAAAAATAALVKMALATAPPFASSLGVTYQKCLRCRAGHKNGTQKTKILKENGEGHRRASGRIGEAERRVQLEV